MAALDMAMPKSRIKIFLIIKKGPPIRRFDFPLSAQNVNSSAVSRLGCQIPIDLESCGPSLPAPERRRAFAQDRAEPFQAGRRRVFALRSIVLPNAGRPSLFRACR